MDSSPDRRLDPLALAGLLTVLAGSAFVFSTCQVAALHCDETNVFRHATSFANGHYASPGRPGLLWLFLAPFTKLGDPVLSTLTLRGLAALASAFTLFAVLQTAGRGGGDEPGRVRSERAWAGLAAVALLATSLDWQGHAFEVRTDTFVLPLTLVAAVQLWRREPGVRRAALAGGMIAVTGLISQKSVYNAGAIGLSWVVFVLASGRPFRLKARAKEAAALVATTLTVMAAWFGALTMVNEPGSDAVGHTFSVAKRTAFELDDMAFETKMDQFTIAFGRAPVLWVLFGLAVLWALAMARRRPRMVAAAVVAAAMLSTVFVHRGFRTYYVASIEPYMALVAGGMLGHLAVTLRRRLPVAIAALPVVIAAGAAMWLSAPEASNLRATSNKGQLELMEAVGEAFPEPVPYFDLLNLVPGYPEVTFLGTGPQRTRFRRGRGRLAAAALDEGASTEQRKVAERHARERAFIERARQRKPHFFIRDYMSRDRYFKKTELRWWWKHYLPYRSNLYLAGGRIRVAGATAGSANVIEILVPGRYTVWFRGGWQGEASVDGETVTHRQQIELTEGRHELAATPDRGSGELWVMLGPDREPEFEEAADQVDWSMFPRDRRDRFQTYDKRHKPADLRTPPWDPSASEADLRARAKRHRRYQSKRQETWATP